MPDSDMAEHSSTEPKRGFLITPFKEELDGLCQVIRDVGEHEGVRIKRADDIFTPGVIIDQILDAVDEAAVIVAITTGRNPNVFFELGYGWRKHHPILLAETSDDLPFDVAAWRSILYGDGYPASDVKVLREHLSKAIRHVLEEGRPLPHGYRLPGAPERKQETRLTARLEASGTKSQRLVIRNVGTTEIHDVGVTIPEEARSFRILQDDLPIDILRPGERVSLLASTVMAGGPSIFDVTVTGTTPDGETVTYPNKISL